MLTLEQREQWNAAVSCATCALSQQPSLGEHICTHLSVVLLLSVARHLEELEAVAEQSKQENKRLNEELSKEIWSGPWRE